MATIWTDSIIISSVTQSIAASTSSFFDLRTAIGGYLNLKVGHASSSAARTVAVDVSVRRVYNNNTATAGGVHPYGTELQTGLTAASCSIILGSSGSALTTTTTPTGFVADDRVCIQDNFTTPSQVEYAKISKIVSSVITMDRPLQYNWTGGYISNQADVFSPIWCDGGSLWEIVIDSGNADGGSSIINANLQTWVS